MAVTAKPSKKQEEDVSSPTDEASIQAVISKGGSTPKKSSVEKTKRTRVQLRLFPDIIDEIDQDVEKVRATKRKPTFSRHQWLEEAIEEKLARESE